MKWDDYRLILALVREKSVRGAARRLGVSHATVSRRLTYLNSGAEGPLIQKSPSGLWPSKRGTTVLEAAEKMEVIINEAARRDRAVEHQLSGPVCLSVPPLVLKHILFDDVLRFVERYPDIDLTIDGSERFVDLDRAEADIVIRTSDTPPEHWVGRRVFPYMLSLYGHKDYLSNNSVSDLKWITSPETGSRGQDWRAQSPYPKAPIGLTITNISGRFEALKRGFGLGRAACFMADPDPDLVRLSGAPLIKAQRFWVLSHPDFSKTMRAQVATRFFAEALQSKKSLIQGDLS